LTDLKFVPVSLLPTIYIIKYEIIDIIGTRMKFLEPTPP